MEFSRPVTNDIIMFDQLVAGFILVNSFESKNLLKCTCTFSIRKIVALFFPGTTPYTSHIFLTLLSICRQISNIYQPDVNKFPCEYKETVDFFHSLLEVRTVVFMGDFNHCSLHGYSSYLCIWTISCAFERRSPFYEKTKSCQILNTAELGHTTPINSLMLTYTVGSDIFVRIFVFSDCFPIIFSEISCSIVHIKDFFLCFVL